MKTKKRQLAAIMFTDIVGYTALMQDDEAIAVATRTRHRNIFESQHESYNGKIVQYYGDGSLSVFNSAVEAVKCAIEIQILLQKGDPVPVRIGIHVGDIVFNATEVYGDGVNFASRIESLGIGGSILVSEKLNDELKNQSDITTISVGHFELKNITNPVEVFAISNEGIVVPQEEDFEGKKRWTSKTIAVLPFVNMSASNENEYFSDGITEEIINALAKIKSLKVTSRTSSFFFKNKNIPIKEIAKQLNVTTILEGSVRRSGDTLRITAQLIQAEEDFHFWSDTWDRQLQNIFEIQDEISLLIADKLREQFGHFEIQDHLVHKQTDNLAAYDYSLKAKFHFRKWNPEDIQESITLYESALELDPNHIESLLGLADSYGFLATTGFMPFDIAWAKSAELVNKAIVIDDQQAGVHYQMANIIFFTANDYHKSYEANLKAIKLNPNYAEAHQFMSFLYIIAGHRKKAKAHLNIALSINPLAQETLFFQAYYEYMVENYEVALKQLNQSIEINPKNLPAHAIRSYCLLKLARYDEVIQYYDNLPKDIFSTDDINGTYALAYALNKDTENTSKYLDILTQSASQPNGFRADSFLFLMYVAIGDLDRAFEWIDDALENKASFLLFHFNDPLVSQLKSDPRHKTIQKRLFTTIVKSNEEIKKKNLLDKQTADEYSTKLLSYVKDEKPYLDQKLSLRSLAAQVDIHPNQLSWLLNERIGKNFSEFINFYRVEAFKRIAKDPKNAHISLVGLAYDSGFNSKTVFNTYFKKETGMTPRQFLKMN